MAISMQQPMRPAEIELVTQVNTNTEGLAAVNSDNVADGSIQATDLSNDVQQQLSFLQTLPDVDYGVSNSISVTANSQTSVTVSFGSTKADTPTVYTAIQCANAVNLNAIVQSVSNTEAAIIVFNNGSTDAENVTVDWLAISGR